MPPDRRTGAISPQPFMHESVRWLSLLITLVLSAVIATLIAIMGTGLRDFPQVLKTSSCIGLSIWGIVSGVMWLTRERAPRWLVFPLAIPLGVFTGDKIAAALLGSEDFISIFVRDPHRQWQSMLATLLFAASATGFIMLFALAANYRLELETGRRRMAEIERAQAVSELALLQAQIEPHFLFNTLAHVLSTVEREPGVAKDMLEHLTLYLRGTLRRSRESQHRLGEELQLITALLSIAAMRLGTRLVYQIKVDPSLHELLLPPLLLQPLVENAIKHGIEPAVNGGEIRIDAATEGEDLVLRVTDTGRGLADAAPEGVGLSNVRARLATLYGTRGGLSLYTHSSRGVIAELRLPAQRIATQ
jgi:two-component sensor histidine kinase